MYHFQTKLLKLTVEHFESQCAQSFFENLSFIFTICVQVFGLHIGSCTICVQCPQKPEKGVRATGTGITDSLGAGSKIGCPGRAASVLNHRVIYQVLKTLITDDYHIKIPSLSFNFYFLQNYFRVFSLPVTMPCKVLNNISKQLLLSFSSMAVPLSMKELITQRPLLSLAPLCACKHTNTEIYTDAFQYWIYTVLLFLLAWYTATTIYIAIF